VKSIHELILNRRSTVLFSDKPIAENIIESLFEAARWAPSSMNQQPWRFIFVVKDNPEYADWLVCLNEKNREWARHSFLLLLTVAQIISDSNNKENVYAVHDTAMAYSNLVFQAISSGLSAHPMGGFDKEKIRQLTKLPNGYEPLTIAAIGYKSDSKDFPSHLLERENSIRKRKSVAEISFMGQFQQ